METLQILGWIYLGVVLGTMGGVIGLGLLQAGKVTSFSMKNLQNFQGPLEILM